MNHAKNGAGIDRNRLVVGELPAQMRSIRTEARVYRRRLEAVVLNAKAAISPTDAHLIDSAAAATAHAGICRWLLRNRLASMSVSDILACSKAIVQAKQARDTAVKTLDLDAPPESPWDAIDVETKEPADD
jgi:hypothetical protein